MNSNDENNCHDDSNKINTMKKQITTSINDELNNLYKKLETKIHHDVMKNIYGDNFYDYSTINIIVNEKVFNYKKYIDMFIENEKIVIYHKLYYDVNNSYYEIFISNYARILYVVNHFQNGINNEIIINDFWIPIDYISIINDTLLSMISKSEQSNDKIALFDIIFFKKILEMIKTILFKRNFIPSYIIDDIDLINREKIMINDSKNEIENEKQRLRSLAKQLEIDKIKFEKERSNIKN